MHAYYVYTLLNITALVEHDSDGICDGEESGQSTSTIHN